MPSNLRSLLMCFASLLAADLSVAQRWEVEKSTVRVGDASVAATTLTVTEEDHGEQVALRVSCRADGVVSAGLRLSKRVEPEDVIDTSKARYASVLIRFPKERETKILLRASLGDRYLHFDDAASGSGDPEIEPLGLELWTVEKLVKRLASSRKVTIRVSVDESQDFQESFNVSGFREQAANLAKECPTLGEWLRP